MANWKYTLKIFKLHSPIHSKYCLHLGEKPLFAAGHSNIDSKLIKALRISDC